MQKILNKYVAAFMAVLALPVLALAPTVSAAASTLTVTPTNNQGWLFSADSSTSTPYEFSEDEASIGEGSLYVPPIGTNASDKFIAIKPIGAPVADFNSVSYDFQIAGNGDAADANQFYLNVYTNLPGSTSFYDCRFDYVPTAGSASDFTTATFNAADTPTNVASRGGATCPTTLAGMVADSTVSFIALNIGDTSTTDVGLGGYLDNVIIGAVGDVITYDFEQDPNVLANKEQCKNGGWETSDVPVFKNQGDCVSSFASKNKANGNPLTNFLRNLL